MVTENFIGQMEEYIKVVGKMENSMEEVIIEVVIVLREKVNGMMEKK